ncbi:6-bladed beta-propeller [Desulfuromonas carbonis]|uniref:hypothetical protein n=1 Tax=Desulfuromonas sp. DDH964 TaxID=1823759 RepID=UPI00078EE45F|nr:hypothetical protein [Desulfuromonas sp. DDH964]AMV73158.1 NHL repeat domain-containing protein [Desulfuromonas sp. DDH964]
MMKRELCRTLVVFAGLLIFAGCAKPPAPMKVYWPAPPDTPKMEWIMTYYSEDSFPKTEGEKFAENIVGKKELHFFQKPMGVASDGHGKMYVADMDLHNLRVVDFNARTMEFFSKSPIFGLPVGVALDGSGRIFVCDAQAQQVFVFAPDRSPLFVFGKGTLQKPGFLAFNEKLKRIYVTDVVGSKIEVFDYEGEHLFSFGGGGEKGGQIFTPYGIAVDSKGRVFVSAQLESRILVYDADGRYLYGFGQRGDEAFQFEGPRGLAFDSEDHLYVAESRKAALLVFDTEGNPLTRIGGERSASPLAFSLPTAVSVDQNDRIFITDAFNRSVTIWQFLTPRYLKEHPLDPEMLKRIEERVERRQKELQEKEGSKPR